MNKSILVIETPKNCDKCKLRSDSDSNEHVYCIGTEIPVGINNLNIIPTWCPLVSEPKHIPVECAGDIYEQLAYTAWNSCINKIEGKDWAEDWERKENE